MNTLPSLRKGIDFTGITVVFFCHDGKGNVVLHKRSEHARDEQGRWDIGGGGVEFGDHPEDTLRSEIKEEYGADVLDFEFLGFDSVKRQQNGVPTHWLALFYKVLINPSQVKNGEPHKFTEIMWCNKETFPPRPAHSFMDAFYERFKDKLFP